MKKPEKLGGARYKRLAIEIPYKGFIYKQEWRNNKYAIYSQWCDDFPDFKGEMILVGYELIEIKKQDAYERFGKKYEAAEMYPNEKQWGKEGWTFKTMKEAEKKLSEICPGIGEIVSIQNGGGTFNGQAYIGQGSGRNEKIS